MVACFSSDFGGSIAVKVDLGLLFWRCFCVGIVVVGLCWSTVVSHFRPWHCCTDLLINKIT